MASAGCSGQGPKVCGATMVFRGTTEDDRKEVARLRDHTHLRLSRATPPAEWYDGAMIAIIPIEPISEAHAFLIVEVFNRFFIDRGGLWDSETCGWGGGDGDGDGDGFDEYYGDGKGGADKVGRVEPRITNQAAERSPNTWCSRNVSAAGQPAIPVSSIRQRAPRQH